MAKPIQQQVIEIIVEQAINHVASGKYVHWDDVETLHDMGPVIDEKWFWDNFLVAVEKTEEQIHLALEAWVTIEYEEAIIERVRAIYRMFERDGEESQEMG